MSDDPNRIAGERFTERWGPDAVRQLIKKAENTRYGGMTVSPQQGRRVVGELGFAEVENDGSVRTICKQCIHVRPGNSGPGKWKYSKCAASLKKNPSKINVITGEIAYSTDDMKFCTSLNDGYCEDYEEKGFGSVTIRSELDAQYPEPPESTLQTYWAWIKYQIGRFADWKINVS